MKKEDKIEWDLGCNECMTYLGFELPSVKSGVDLHDIVDLVRILKTNNAMPFYIKRYLLKYKATLVRDIENLNEGISDSKLLEWLDKHWKHSISAKETINGLYREEIHIPRRFTPKDLEALGL
jgi:hypothetical protein